jgi:hypothetical protein
MALALLHRTPPRGIIPLSGCPLNRG